MELFQSILHKNMMISYVALALVFTWVDFLKSNTTTSSTLYLYWIYWNLFIIFFFQVRQMNWCLFSGWHIGHIFKFRQSKRRYEYFFVGLFLVTLEANLSKNTRFNLLQKLVKYFSLLALAFTNKRKTSLNIDNIATIDSISYSSPLL